MDYWLCDLDGETEIMMKKVRVGIIGTGKHGSRYANHIVNDLGDYFTLAGISRRSPEGVLQAKAWQTRCFHNWRELVADAEVDALIAVTTPNLNRDIAFACADAKKPLLLEKPLATDIAVAREIVDCFAGNPLGLTVGQTLRYNSVIRELKAQYPSMGTLYSLFAGQRLEPSTIPWLENPDIAGGGVIFHTAVHIFDALRFITGLEPLRVRCSVRSVFNTHMEDLLTTEIEFENGAMGILDSSKVSQARSGRYEFVCEKGQLQGDQVHGILQRIEQNRIIDLPLIPMGPTILPLLKDWYDYLCGRGRNPVPGEEGMAAVKVCHGCRLAAESGNWVELSTL